MNSKSTDQPSKEVSITISNKTFFRIALLTVSWVALVAAVVKASSALILIAVAFFLALALDGPVHWISKNLPGKRKGSRTLGTAISFLIVIAVLGTFIASMVPPLVKQTNNFLHAAPGLIKDFRDQDSATGKFIRQYGLEKQVNELSDEIASKVKGSGSTAFGAVQTAGSSLFAVLTVLVMTFMMLIEGPRWFEIIMRMFPKGSKRNNARRLAYDMNKVVKGFINGQVTLAAIAAVMIFPVLLLLGVSYPVALLFIVFICGLIPMFGHTIGAVIVSLVALFNSVPAALIVLGYYILYQQLENYFVQPKIQANATNMSPLLVFIAVVIGISFGGIFAALFAIPVAGVLRILVLEYMRSRNLIEDSEYHQEVNSKTK